MRKAFLTSKRNNITGRYYAAAELQGTTVSSDTFENYLRYKAQIDMKQVQALKQAMREIVLEQLKEGNSVNVFDLVVLEPQARCVKSVNGTRDEVERAIVELTDDDLQMTLRAAPSNRLRSNFTLIIHNS